MDRDEGYIWSGGIWDRWRILGGNLDFKIFNFFKINSIFLGINSGIFWLYLNVNSYFYSFMKKVETQVHEFGIWANKLKITT
jgi:hypothetical protein